MTPAASGYLYTLAALSITFVGFSALVIVLRQTLGGDLSRLDLLLTKIFVQLGFLVAGAALMPPLLALLQCPEPLVWRLRGRLLRASPADTIRDRAKGNHVEFRVWS